VDKISIDSINRYTRVSLEFSGIEFHFVGFLLEISGGVFMVDLIRLLERELTLKTNHFNTSIQASKFQQKKNQTKKEHKKSQHKKNFCPLNRNRVNI
jgi:hypothetical protein